MTIENFIEMEKLELKYYNEEHVTPHEEAYKWHLEFSNSDVALEDKGKIIAFMDMMPIKDLIFEQIKEGHFNDKYLTTEHIVKMENLEEGDTVNLLLSCVVVDEEYRRTDALKILLTTYLHYYLSFTKRGVNIEHIITSNVTEHGERFSEKLGFRRIGLSDHDTALYLIPFDDFAAGVEQL